MSALDPLPIRQQSHSLVANLIHAASIVLLLVGCSKQPPDATGIQLSEPAAQVAKPGDAQVQSAVVKEYKSNAGGIATKYRAHFEDGMLLGISETRELPNQGQQGGEYRFHGARLVAYRGAALDREGELAFEFDSDGQPVSAHSTRQGKSTAASEEEISAIRNRAALLRSHTLAQRAAHDHVDRAAH